MSELLLAIRPYTPADEHAVLDVWLRSTIAGQDFLPRSYWESQVEIVRAQYLPAAVTFVAEDGGRIVGFIALLGTLIGGLFVEPEAQGRSVGRLLVEYARGQCGRPLSVEVYELNTRARRFYDRCGFRETGRTVQQETGCTLVIMEQSGGSAETSETPQKSIVDAVTDGLVEGAVAVVATLLFGGD